MALDINKIIRESITESTNEAVDDKDTTIVENIVDTNDTTTVAESNTTNETSDGNKMCIASAISAGLGAMNLRNHLRTM